MKRIKNLTLGMLGTTVLSLGLYACSNDDAKTINSTTTKQKTSVVNVEEYPNLVNLETTAIFLTPRVEVEENQHALTLYLKDFESAELEKNYIINGIEISDDGLGYDKIAGDGVYTSKKLFVPTEENFVEVKRSFVGEKFRYQGELNEFLNANDYLQVAGKKFKIAVKGGCKVRYVTTGNSALGIPCKYGGCLEFYDCKEVEVEFEFSIEFGK